MATKTTIEIDDELFVSAKRHAASRRTTMRTLVERGLRDQLRPQAASHGAARKKIRWVTVDGGVAPVIDLTDRTSMTDAISRR